VAGDPLEHARITASGLVHADAAGPPMPAPAITIDN
jgi:hypothetical protein